MHRIVLTVVAVLVISLSTVALAKSENSNSNSGKDKNQGQPNSQGSSNSKSPKKGPSAAAQFAAQETTPSAACDPNANWKNHGEYVSCVAKLKLGGQAVSEAARSDVGKKHGTPSGSINPSPTASASGSPEATPTATPEATSSGIIGLTEDVRHEIAGIVNNIAFLLARLQELLSF